MKLLKKKKSKMGTKKDPLVLRVNDESRAEELMTICNEHNWTCIIGIEYDEDEDISDLEFMLNPELFNRRPKAGRNTRKTSHTSAKYKGKITSRNGPCPCGSGKKFKKCCM